MVFVSTNCTPDLTPCLNHDTININIIICVPGKSQIAALPFLPLQFLANRHTTQDTATPTPPTPWAGTTIQGEIEALLSGGDKIWGQENLRRGLV